MEDTDNVQTEQTPSTELSPPAACSAGGSEPAGETVTGATTAAVSAPQQPDTQPAAPSKTGAPPASKASTEADKDAAVAPDSKLSNTALQSSSAAQAQRITEPNPSPKNLTRIAQLMQYVTEDVIKAGASQKPSEAMTVVAGALCVLLEVPRPSWSRAKQVISKRHFLEKLGMVQPSTLDPRSRHVACVILQKHPQYLHKLSMDEAILELDVVLTVREETASMTDEAKAELLCSVLYCWCVCIAWFDTTGGAEPDTQLAVQGARLDALNRQAFSDE